MLTPIQKRLACGPVRRCARCTEPLDSKQRYCRSCHAAYMRNWRAKQRGKLQRLREAALEITARAT